MVRIVLSARGRIDPSRFCAAGDDDVILLTMIFYQQWLILTGCVAHGVSTWPRGRGGKMRPSVYHHRRAAQHERRLRIPHRCRTPSYPSLSRRGNRKSSCLVCIKRFIMAPRKCEAYTATSTGCVALVRYRYVGIYPQYALFGGLRIRITTNSDYIG